MFINRSRATRINRIHHLKMYRSIFSGLSRLGFRFHKVPYNTCIFMYNHGRTKIQSSEYAKPRFVMEEFTFYTHIR